MFDCKFDVAPKMILETLLENIFDFFQETSLALEFQMVNNLLRRYPQF